MRHNAMTTLLAIMLTLCVGAPALAYFGWSMAAPGNAVTTGAWGPLIGLECGTSKAVRNSGPGPADVSSIASVDEAGRMSLDFGEVRPGNSNASPDVLRIDAYRQDVRVELAVEGDVAALIGDMRLFPGTGDLVQESVTRRVYVKLDVPLDRAPGDVIGVLVISVDGGTEVYRLPVLISVRSSGQHSAGTPESLAPFALPVGSVDASGSALD